jgi:uncharacterized protein with GYD domain
LEEMRRMPTFVILGKFTQKGIENIKDFQKIMAFAIETGKQHGIEVKAMYFTFGQYDFVTITEAPSAEISLQRLFALGSRGSVRTETLLAVPFEKGIKEISKLE